ncbi:hypothetical protein LZC95_45485 [Pendulispora brunnea]|uniref:Uncharacterized protein n=1 Tax=Pendulispora brunnea TaxID=2905690 RepID=A0ABZ2K9A6_9BACT
MKVLHSRYAEVTYACVISTLAVFAAYAGGCSSDSGGEPVDAGTDRGSIVPLPDASGPCDLTKPFGAPILLDGVNLPATESGTLSPDELTFYSMSKSSGRWHIYAATRQSLDGAFGPPKLFEGIRPSGELPEDFDPFLSFDGNQFFFSSIREGAGTPGDFDIMVATRPSPGAPFDPPIGIGTINTATGVERSPVPNANNSVLYFSGMVPNNTAPSRVYKSVRTGAEFGSPEVIDLGATTGDGSPVLDQSDLTMFFGSSRTGSQQGDVWVAKRQNVTGKFTGSTNAADVAALNSDSNDTPRWLSVDGCRIYLASDRPVPNDAGTGRFNMYVATRPK